MPIPNKEREQIIQTLLQSSEGKQRLAASMVEPLRERLNQNSLARKIFQVEPLQGTHTSSTYGEVTRVPEVEIHSTQYIPLTQIRSNVVDSFDRIHDSAIDEIRRQEDTCLKEIFSETKESTTITNAREMIEGIHELQKKAIEPSKIIMNRKTYSKFLDSDFNESNKSNNYCGIEIQISDVCTDDEILMLGKPEQVGSISVRQDLTCQNADDPSLRSIGFTFYETIGMEVKQDSVVKMKVDTRNEEEKARDKHLEKMKKIRRYQFISKG